MDWKKIGKAMLFPHIAIMVILIPISAVSLICSMVFLGTESPVAIVSYVVAAYTLTVWCFKIPNIVRFFNNFKNENKYAIMLQSDARLRVNLSLYGSLAGNSLYGIFHFYLGYYHSTFWFYSLGAYYICLAIMRFFLLLHTRKYTPGERMRTELRKYRACGWIFLVMNMALTVIVLFMLIFDRTFVHHMITAIAMAAFTFTAFTAAIVNVIRYKKFNSPVFSAAKAISFAAACVSMLTLTSTMLTAFSDGTMDVLNQKIMLGSVGFTVSAIVLAMAIFMIINGSKKLKTEVENGQQQ